MEGKKKTKEAEEEPKTTKSVIEQFASEIKNTKARAAKMQATAIETQKARLAEMQKSVNATINEMKASINEMKAATAELRRTFKTYEIDFMKDVASTEFNIAEMAKHIWGPYPPFTKITSILGAAAK